MNTETSSEIYFTAEDIEHVKWYLLEEDKASKERIYNKYLYSFINKQIEAVMNQMNKGGSFNIMNNYEDFRQDLHIHILTNVLPIVDIKKVKAIQNLLWISIKNKLINMLKALDSRTKIKYDYNEYNLDEKILMDELEPSKEDIIKKIQERIIELKLQQPIVNCVAYTYLEYLDRYIKMNDYDASGFKEYCMDKMKIGNSRFLSLSHSFGFRTIAFKNKKNN